MSLVLRLAPALEILDDRLVALDAAWWTATAPYP